MSVLIDVADAVTAELNGHVFSQEFTATRTYADWDEQLSTYELRSDVVPVASMPTELDTRGSVNYLCSVDIGIRKKLEAGDSDRVDAEIVDPLVRLIEEIHEWTIGKELNYDATWESTIFVAAYVPEHLRQNNQFTGIVRVTYSVSKCLEHSAESS
jgi:hypothetical protein